jgi:hypothetical protein
MDESPFEKISWQKGILPHFCRIFDIPFPITQQQEFAPIV